jgi:mannitol-specific phosphotransferase system IIBC component
LIWFLVFLFGGLRALSAIGSAEKREQTKKPNETNEAEGKESEKNKQINASGSQFDGIKLMERIDLVCDCSPGPPAKGAIEEMKEKTKEGSLLWRLLNG